MSDTKVSIDQSRKLRDEWSTTSERIEYTPWLEQQLLRHRTKPDVGLRTPCNVGNHTLTVTHVFDGEEVVTGGEDGQAWVATFADPIEANAYVRFRQDWSWMVGAQRNRASPVAAAQKDGET